MLKIKNPHASSVQTVVDALHVVPAQGLGTAAVNERLSEFGPNQLRKSTQTGVLVLLVRQLKSPIAGLLLVAAAFSLYAAEYAEVIAIMAVLIINTAIGFLTELQAQRSMQSLRNLNKVQARVRRNGVLAEVVAEDLVPGDVLVLDAGDVLAADARVILSANLACDESALTGESLPVSKSDEPVPENAVLGDRTDMVYKGCGVTRGTGEAVVTSTGMNTELGRISRLVDSAESERSPLEKQLSSLSHNLIWVTIALTGVLILIGMIAGQDSQLMIKSAVALAVAAIPEGLPIVATLALARGMVRMSRHNALIEQLSSVETLGATTVILTDKTGTLTENHMRVVQIQTADAHYTFDSGSRSFETRGTSVDLSAESPEHNTILQLLRNAALCTNASYDAESDSGVGDTMEVALLEVATAAGLSRSSLIQSFKEIDEHAFDSALRLMATVHADGDRFLYAIKGAPAAVLEHATHVAASSEANGVAPITADEMMHWQQVYEQLAGNGLRVLAIAGKTELSADAQPYKDLILLGVVAFNDPPREDVTGAIADAQSAGIRVIMVTGDHMATARYIADSVGLTNADSQGMNGSELPDLTTPTKEVDAAVREVDLFSRVDPEQKLRLIELHQRAGEVVAMTGDGVNDAPALKMADIGVAMGTRGTEVAKEASDMILKDDAFPTIVHAIREGRIIYSNIRRFTVYLLSCNFSEILIVTIAVASGLPLPLLPLQILFLNLVTDVFPAFALGTIEPGRDVLARKPRSPSEPILGRRQWQTIIVHGVILSSATLTALLFGLYVLELSADQVTTTCFMTLALSQLWHLFGMHNWRESWLNTAIAVNRYVWLAVMICLILLGLAMWQPQLASVLRLVPLPFEAWAVIAGLSVAPWTVRELSATVTRISRRG